MSDSGGFRDEVATGDRRRALEALRSVLAEAIIAAEPRDTASLARQLQQVLKDLDEMPPAKGGEVSFLDRIGGNAKDRIAAAQAS